MEVKQIFLSHTQKDKNMCDGLDKVAPRIGMKIYRSEFENIPQPAWTSIRDAINESVALFFVVGPELYKMMELPLTLLQSQAPKTQDDETKIKNWRFTQNWIAYEIGVACQRNIDVWVLYCGLRLNFPMPYVNNCCQTSYDLIRHKPTFEYLKYVFKQYSEGQTFSVGDKYKNSQEQVIVCPSTKCRAIYNFHTTLSTMKSFKCPQCLRAISVPPPRILLPRK